MFKAPEKYRWKKYSTQGEGPNGVFKVPQRKGAPLLIIASDGMGWEHVSVSLPNRAPTWEEMAKVKELFWGDDDCVIQYHPPKKDYVNDHPYCLHLWRPVKQNLPRPSPLLVGLHRRK